MFRNYLTAALRNLAHNKLYAAINIVGLTVGFTAAILIALFVRDEFSYDTWIPGFDRTYLLAETLGMSGRTAIESHATPVELAKSLALDFPSIEAVSRISEIHGSAKTSAFRHGDVESNEAAFWADPNIFQVLPVPAVAGDLKTALEQPDSVVLSRTMARKYFGRDDPVGETIELNREHSLKVAAVIEDLPSSSHLKFDVVVSGLAAFSFFSERNAHPIPARSWNSAGYTYIRLKPGTSARELDEALPAFLDRHMSLSLPFFTRVSLWLVPISSVHLRYENSSTALKPVDDPTIAYGLAAIGLLIILVAAINFVNLMTGRATRRAVEVGVRKTTGGQRVDLIAQFLGEALLYTAISMAIAVVLSGLLLPTFNALLNRIIVFDPIHDAGFASGLAGITLLVGTLGGFYPAFVISAFKPAAVLKSAVTQASGSGVVRQILVALQFAILISLIIGTATIYRQTSFALNEGLRLKGDQIILIATHCTTALPDRVRALPGVRAAACANDSGLNFGNGNETFTGMNGIKAPLAFGFVDYGFFDIYGLKPLAGRFFLRDRGGDSMPPDGKDSDVTSLPSLVLNESATRELGFQSPGAAVGEHILEQAGPDRELSAEIIGVVPDFSWDSIHSLVPPTVYLINPRAFNWLHIKLTGHDIPETLQAIDNLWQEVGDPRPITRLFLNDEVQKLYDDIRRQSQIFAVFSGIALFIACLGLFGLAAFTAERRTKEIGIRKAMGASRPEILRLLLWQFAKPVVWANVIAWPAGYTVARHWLEGFAHHVEMKPWMFLAASAVAVAIAVLTVTGHALLVARAKPVTALRYE